MVYERALKYIETMQQIDVIQRLDIYRSEPEYEALRNVYIYLYVIKALDWLTRAEAEGGGEAIQVLAIISRIRWMTVQLGPMIARIRRARVKCRLESP